jgi:hypothetical protein
VSKFIDLTNKVFGRLTVISKVEDGSKSVNFKWNCVCVCGNEIVVFGGNLRRNHTRSCGCLQSDELRERSTTHGLRKHQLYKVWHWMIQRCYCEYSTSYKNYGARGISVCDEWRYSVENFFLDMSNGWAKGLQLDRINNNGNYCKENCRWVTPKENNRNTRKTKLNVEKASYIRNSNKSTTDLMKEFSVCKTTINNIKSNKSWT